MKKTLLLLIPFISIVYANAGTIVVTNTNDSGTGSLREAVSIANAGDTIRFALNLIASGSDSIVLNSSISFQKNLVFKGLYNNSDTLFVSGGGNDRIFTIDSTEKVVVDSMVLINGYNNYHGAAVWFKNSDSLLVYNSSLKNNMCLNCSGSGIYSEASGLNKSIYICIINTHIINNESIAQGGYYSGRGGGIHCESNESIKVEILKSKFNSNQAKSGGGIFLKCNSGAKLIELSIDSSYFNNNSATQNGGAIYVDCGLSKVNIKSSFLTNNLAIDNGGGIYSFCNGSFNSFINVLKSKLLYNSAQGDGGGIYQRCLSQTSSNYAEPVKVEYSILRGNSANNGGGVFSFHQSSSSKVKIIKSILDSNIAILNGGGLNLFANGSDSVIVDYSTLKNNEAQYGGGIYSYASANTANTGVVQINHSTLNGNLSTFDGGGIYSKAWSTGTISQMCNAIINCSHSTVTNNISQREGGGMFAYTSAQSPKAYSYIYLTNSTVYGNKALSNGEAIRLYSSSAYSTFAGYLYPKGSIIACNGSNDDNISFSNNNSWNRISSNGFNIFGDSIRANINYDSTDLTDIDSSQLLLSELLFNGGSTKTRIPLSPSVAIDNGDTSDLTDAQNRSVIGRRDIGAGEYNCQIVLYDTIYNCGYYNYKGSVYYNSGNYVNYIVNNSGCDSIFNLMLIISNSISIQDTIVSCELYISPSGKIWFNSGIYHDTITNNLGCDSIITINLTINTISDSILKTDSSLVAFEIADSYQWLDCSNNYASITNDTNRSLNNLLAGNYSVEITKNGCVDTSKCVAVTSCEAKYYPTQLVPGQVILLDSTTGSNLKYTWYFGDGDSAIAQLPTHTYTNSGTYEVCLLIQDTIDYCNDYFCDSITVDSTGVLRNSFTINVVRNIASVTEITKNNFSLYPNPNNGSFTIDLKERYKDITISVFDLNGRLFKREKYNNQSQINLGIAGSNGIYFLNISTEKGEVNFRVIKN